MSGMVKRYQKALQKEQESENMDGVEAKQVAIEFSSRLRMESIKGLNNFDDAIIMIRSENRNDDHIKPNFSRMRSTGVQKPAEAANSHTLFSQHAKDALVSRNHPAQATKQTTKNAYVRDKDIRAGIGDRSAAGVEVEFYKSPYSRKLLEYAGSDSITALRYLNLTLGLSIAPLKYAGSSGTGGLYLSDGDDMYFLTSCHVVPAEGQAEQSECCSSHAPRSPIFDDIDICKDEVKEYKDQLSQLRRDEESGLDVKAIRADTELKLRNEEANVQKLEDFKNNAINKLRDFDDRVIGHVVYALIGEGCFIEDWALIKLNRGTIDWSTFKGNVIDLGSELIKDMYPDTFDYPDDRLLPIKGVVSIDELVNCGEGMTFIKNGVTTGTTIGRGIGMIVVEHSIGNNTKLLGNMFAIAPVQVEGRFSYYGDSGSIVVDSRGRAAGLLTGGNNDMSFIIPIALILERVKIAFPGMQLYSVPV
ncbi:hypothetical protein BDQ17DRAFT_1369257 [Cyathus striatus]|nr:hypothetical protein BDQ17DRAFT_1369257 [Cyathus striatus]